MDMKMDVRVGKRGKGEKKSPCVLQKKRKNVKIYNYLVEKTL